MSDAVLNETDYRELAPPARLADAVACVWWRRGPGRRVLPDGCADIVWTGARLIVAGPATRAVEPAVRADATKLGVRFRVGAAGDALGLPAAELRDRTPALGELWSRGGEFEERVAAAPGAAERMALLCAAVSSMREATAPDPLVRAAVGELARPRARVAQLGLTLGISERQLRRRFQEAVGYSPRTLARVLRLQRFLRLAATSADLAWLAADAGYADQSHLTRDCTELAGLPPAALLAAGAGPAGERKVGSATVYF